MGSESTAAKALASVRSLELPASVAASLVDVSTLARTRQLPVAESLSPLFAPLGFSGLPRGSRVCVDSGASSRASVSLTFGLMVEAMRQGSWAAVVGCPWLGLAAVQECQVPLSQLVMINEVNPHWGAVMASLVDGFDLVVFAGRSVGARDARRVQAHAREKGAVLLQIGDRGWPESADVQLTVTNDQWQGVGQGHGHFQSRRAEVQVTGRRRAMITAPTPVWLPDAEGRIRVLTAAEIADQTPAPESQFAGSDIDHLLEVHDGLAETEDPGPRGVNGPRREEPAPRREEPGLRGLNGSQGEGSGLRGVNGSRREEPGPPEGRASLNGSLRETPRRG